MSVISVRIANLRKLGYKDIHDWKSKEGNFYIGR